MEKMIYTINDLNALDDVDILHHAHFARPDFVKSKIEYTDLYMLGTIKDPQWRCRGNYGKYHTNYCFGTTPEEAQANVRKTLAKQWFTEQQPIHENDYVRAMHL